MTWEKVVREATSLSRCTCTHSHTHTHTDRQTDWNTHRDTEFRDSGEGALSEKLIHNIASCFQRAQLSDIHESIFIFPSCYTSDSIAQTWFLMRFCSARFWMELHSITHEKSVLIGDFYIPNSVSERSFRDRAKWLSVSLVYEKLLHWKLWTLL